MNEVPQYMPQPQYNPEMMYEPQLQGSHPDSSVVLELFAQMEKKLDMFEARLRGKTIDESGKLVPLQGAEAYIKTDRAARDFMDIIRSKVNPHIDFSYYTEKEAIQLISGAASHINRWLMMQGEEVPLRYRRKLADHAMSLISASYHKAINGRMLTTLRGLYKENVQTSSNPEQQRKQGWFDKIFNRNRQTF